MTEGGAAPKGRGTLPGVPSYVDRVSAENIWRDFCNGETSYYQSRKTNPPRGRESFGALHGFEVVRHTSYMSVRRVRAGEQGSGGGTGAGLTLSASEPRLTMAASGGSGGSADGEALAARAVDSTGSAGRLEGSSNDTLVLPKYARFSEDHMLPMEVAPHRHQSAANFGRILARAPTKG